MLVGVGELSAAPGYTSRSLSDDSEPLDLKELCCWDYIFGFTVPQMLSVVPGPLIPQVLTTFGKIPDGGLIEDIFFPAWENISLVGLL